MINGVNLLLTMNGLRSFIIVTVDGITHLFIIIYYYYLEVLHTNERKVFKIVIVFLTRLYFIL